MNYFLQTDQRNLDRYDAFKDKYGTYGVFELPEGAVLRHQSEEWVRQLLAAFHTEKFSHLTFRTMNGHTSNGFYYLGRK